MAVAILLATASPAPAQDCRPAEGGAATAQIVAVTERFDFALDDGRLARAAGLAPAPPDFGGRPAEAARATLQAAVGGRPARVEIVGPVDRWGRVPALIFLTAGAGAGEAGEAALAIGAARVGDGREAGRCAAARLAAEAQARAAGLGLWADPYYAVVAAEDRPGLALRIGQFALVEGRIRRVGAGRQRFYLDFGPRRDDFTVTVVKKAAASFQANGAPLSALAGARVRVRGLIEPGPTPRIDLVSPGALEVLEPAPRGGRP
ncbi:MAG: nuclease [Methylobacteriaceae bacterium]|nr:nuclease [Methylobacteriaceae bacterium]